MKRTLLFVLCAAALAACEAASPVASVPGTPRAYKPAPGSAVLYHPFEIRSGKSTPIVDEGLGLTLAEVVEDSRCPAEVTCKTSGNARIRVRISRDGASPATLELNTLVGPTTALYQGYEVELLELRPEASLSRIPLRDYRAVVVVRRVPAATLGTPFTLAPDGVVVVAGTDLEVRFVQVTEDSRCPVGVTCIWEGNAGVEITARMVPAGVADLYTLNTALEPRSVVVGAYRIELLGLEPQRTTNGPAQSEYRATFVVTTI